LIGEIEMAKKTHIIIHHSATTDGITNSWPAIRKYHIETMGWRDIGYHWGVENVNGKIIVQKGRDESVSGAHTSQANMNELGIGICIVGNFDVDKPTEETYRVTAELCADICKRHGIPVSNIHPHNKYANKSCPGKNFDMNKLIGMVTFLLEEESRMANTAPVLKDIKGHWAENDILFAASLGLVKGDPNGMFYPNNFITRAEATTLLVRLYKLLKGV
jgi:N-acetylmuramoyl-L-alanine amidase